MTANRTSLLIQGREVDIASIRELVLGTATDTFRLVGPEASFALQAMLRGEDLVPNTAALPPHPLVASPNDYLVGDVLVCTNPAFPEHWILVGASERLLDIIVDGERDQCSRDQWTTTTENWHRTRPPLEWLVEQGLDAPTMAAVQAARDQHARENA